MKAEQKLEVHLKDDEFERLLREATQIEGLDEYPEGPLVYHEASLHQWRLVFYGKQVGGGDAR